jgi:hypothetical protein
MTEFPTTATEGSTTELLTETTPNSPDTVQAAPSTDEDGEVTDILAELCDDTLTPAERLENQFDLVHRWTIDGDRLESRVLRVLKSDPRSSESPAEGSESPDSEDSTDNDDSDSVYLLYWLPTEEVAIEEFQKPVPWNPDEYAFAEIVEKIGYGPGSLHEVEGEPIVIKKTADGWAVPDASTEDITRSAHTGDYTEGQSPLPDSSLITTVSESFLVNRHSGRIAGIAIGLLFVVGIHRLFSMFGEVGAGSGGTGTLVGVLGFLLSLLVVAILGLSIADPKSGGR